MIVAYSAIEPLTKIKAETTGRSLTVTVEEQKDSATKLVLTLDRRSAERLHLLLAAELSDQDMVERELAAEAV